MAATPAESPRHASHRHESAARRSRSLHTRPLILDSRRPRAAPSDDDPNRGSGHTPLRAAPVVANQVQIRIRRRRTEPRRYRGSRVSSRGRDDRLLASTELGTGHDGNRERQRRHGAAAVE